MVKISLEKVPYKISYSEGKSYVDIVEIKSWQIQYYLSVKNLYQKRSLPKTVVWFRRWRRVYSFKWSLNRIYGFCGEQNPNIWT